MVELPPGLIVRLLWLLYKGIRAAKSFLSPFGATPNLSWNEFNFAIKILVYRSSRFNPDIIVGVGVGGAVTAATLAGNMNTRFISIDREIKWNSTREVTIYDDSKSKDRKENISGKKILLISAEIISGQSTKKVRDYLMTLSPKEVKIGCIDYNPIAAVNVAPDYYYISTNKIIQKPWRILASYNCPDDNARIN